MTTPTTVAFQIHSLPANMIEEVRADGVGAHGTPVEHLTAGGGEPLRCCLRNAQPGEKAMLFGYQLPLPASPYREIGPVFAHHEPCEGRDGNPQPKHRLRVLHVQSHPGGQGATRSPRS